MKFRKTTLLILGIGVLCIVFVALFMAYLQRNQQRNALFLTIETAKNQVAKINTEKRTLEPQASQLEQKIADLKASYDKARGEFPGVSIQSIENDEELSRLAESCAVTITTLSAAESSPKKEGNLTFIISSYNVELSGDRTNLLDFIHRVRLSTYFHSASVESLGLTEATPVPEATPSEIPMVAPSALTMSITIYRYEGN